MQVTMIVAGMLGLSMLGLGMSVVQFRMKARISLGDGDNPDLQTRIRAHGNAAEWIPIGLILLFLAEQAQGAHWLVVAGAALLLAGRLLHPLGLRNRSPNLARTLGMLFTWAAIGGLAILVFVHGIGFR